MKKNLLSKIRSSAVMLTACLDESGVNYDSEVNTLCDDEPEYMNHI